MMIIRRREGDTNCTVSSTKEIRRRRRNAMTLRCGYKKREWIVCLKSTYSNAVHISGISRVYEMEKQYLGFVNPVLLINIYQLSRNRKGNWSFY